MVGRRDGCCVIMTSLLDLTTFFLFLLRRRRRRRRRRRLPFQGLVNNAGILGPSKGQTLMELGDDLDKVYHEVFAVNVMGPMYCCREAGARMTSGGVSSCNSPWPPRMQQPVAPMDGCDSDVHSRNRMV